MMHLVEQHLISRRDPRFAPMDAAAFASKNLYHAALDEVRPAFIFEGRSLCTKAVSQRMKHTEANPALPCTVSKDVLGHLDKNWRACFAAGEASREAPGTFTGRPKLPRYKDKTKGRCVLIQDRQASSRRALTEGRLRPSGLALEVETAHRRVKQARSVPRIGFSEVEIVSEQHEAAPSGSPALDAAVDLGLDQLCALPANTGGFAPRLVNGRVLKSCTQFYNKRRADLQEALERVGTTARLERLTCKRTRRITHSLHAASKTIIDVLVSEGIGTLVIGKNLLWKQEIALGRVNHQPFVQLPHARFIDLLSYKAQVAGIRVMRQEESSPSKASFLDGDPIPVYDSHREDKPVFSGKRVERGLYRAKNGRRIQADVNGSYNSGRKAVPNSFGQGREAVAVRPVRLDVGSVSPARGAGGHVSCTNLELTG